MTKEIGISAVRGGTIVGEHEVIFAGQDEVIEFKHTAYSKAIFGKGAVEAAKYPCRKTGRTIRYERCDRWLRYTKKVKVIQKNC